MGSDAPGNDAGLPVAYPNTSLPVSNEPGQARDGEYQQEQPRPSSPGSDFHATVSSTTAPQAQEQDPPEWTRNPYTRALSNARMMTSHYQATAHSSASQLYGLHLALQRSREEAQRERRRAEAAERELVELRRPVPTIPKDNTDPLEAERYKEQLNSTRNTYNHLLKSYEDVVSELERVRYLLQKSEQKALAARNAQKEEKAKIVEIRGQLHLSNNEKLALEAVVDEYAKLVRKLESERAAAKLLMSRSSSSSDPSQQAQPPRSSQSSLFNSLTSSHSSVSSSASSFSTHSTATSATELSEQPSPQLLKQPQQPEAQAQTPSQSSIESLQQGRLGITRIVTESNLSITRLEDTIDNLNSSINDLEERLEAERKSHDDTSSRLTKALTSLEERLSQDDAADSLLRSYMSFYQASHERLHNLMTEINDRYAASTSTLTNRAASLENALMVEITRAERLRSAMEEMTSDLAKESFSRRQEVKLRLEQLEREQKIVDWLKNECGIDDVENTVFNCSKLRSLGLFDEPESAAPNEDDNPDVLLQGRHPSMQNKALLRNLVDKLFEDLEAESKKRMCLEQKMAESFSFKAFIQSNGEQQHPQEGVNGHNKDNSASTEHKKQAVIQEHQSFPANHGLSIDMTGAMISTPAVVRPPSEYRESSSKLGANLSSAEKSSEYERPTTAFSVYHDSISSITDSSFTSPYFNSINTNKNQFYNFKNRHISSKYTSNASKLTGVSLSRNDSLDPEYHLQQRGISSFAEQVPVFPPSPTILEGNLGITSLASKIRVHFGPLKDEVSTLRLAIDQVKSQINSSKKVQSNDPDVQQSRKSMSELLNEIEEQWESVREDIDKDIANAERAAHIREAQATLAGTPSDQKERKSSPVTPTEKESPSFDITEKQSVQQQQQQQDEFLPTLGDLVEQLDKLRYNIDSAVRQIQESSWINIAPVETNDDDTMETLADSATSPIVGFDSNGGSGTSSAGDDRKKLDNLNPYGALLDLTTQDGAMSPTSSAFLMSPPLSAASSTFPSSFSQQHHQSLFSQLQQHLDGEMNPKKDTDSVVSSDDASSTVNAGGRLNLSTAVDDEDDAKTVRQNTPTPTSPSG